MIPQSPNTGNRPTESTFEEDRRSLIPDGSDLTHFEHGIIYRNNDLGLPPAPSAINVRVTNSVIWNNPLGGVVASSDVQEAPHTTYMICPIILSTIAGNGSSSAVDPFSGQVADYNVEYFEFGNTTHQTEYIYEFTDPILVPQATIGTRFSNLILQRQVPGSGSNDFGPHTRRLNGELAGDETDPNLVFDDEIGVAAVRADLIGITGFPLSKSDPAPFSGPLNWNGLVPTIFSLTGSGSFNFFSESWQYLLTGQTEALHDFLGAVRDPLRSTPMPAAEKGGFEL